jgi:hypothetical protein
MNDFQTATRLTEDEATDLTLRPLAPRYPPIAHSLDVVRADKRIPALDWLFPAAARYCSDCPDASPTGPRRGRTTAALEDRLETARRLRLPAPPPLPRTSLPRMPATDHRPLRTADCRLFAVKGVRLAVQSVMESLREVNGTDDTRSALEDRLRTIATRSEALLRAGTDIADLLSA